MENEEIRIVRLEAERVACVHAFGTDPESEAWENLVAWAKPKGLLDKPEIHQIYGYNNPNPSPGSPNYGYEFCITVGPEVEGDDEVEIKTMIPGLYAVLRWDGQGDPYVTIPETWERLFVWRENSRYTSGGHHCYEQRLEATGGSSVEFLLDLFLPISE
jgi:AraC family transcriptional regulator